MSGVRCSTVMSGVTTNCYVWRQPNSELLRDMICPRSTRHAPRVSYGANLASPCATRHRQGRPRQTRRGGPRVVAPRIRRGSRGHRLRRHLLRWRGRRRMSPVGSKPRSMTTRRQPRRTTQTLLVWLPVLTNPGSPGFGSVDLHTWILVRLPP